MEAKIIANTCITKSFRLMCVLESRYNKIPLRSSNLETESLYVDFKGITFTCTIHRDNYNRRIFLN